MFEIFTERARQVISIARQEARRLRGDSINPEHILLGILREGGGGAAKVLQDLAGNPRRIEEAVESLVTIAPGPPDDLGMLPFSPHAKRALELARGTADGLGHSAVGTEHLLLGLIMDQEGIAARALLSLQFDLQGISAKLIEVLREYPAPVVPARKLLDPALVDRSELQGAVTQLLQQGRDIALVGPAGVGKSSLVRALADDSIRHYRDAATLTEFPTGSGRAIFECRPEGLEAFVARFPEARDLATVTLAPPDPVECDRLLKAGLRALKAASGYEVAKDVFEEADRLAREKIRTMIPPWGTLRALWDAVPIQKDLTARGDMQQLEKDIEQLEREKSPHADALKRHLEGLRSTERPDLSIECIRVAIMKLSRDPD